MACAHGPSSGSGETAARGGALAIVRRGSFELASVSGETARRRRQRMMRSPSQIVDTPENGPPCRNHLKMPQPYAAP
ncbi:hypothetical protein ACFFX0_25260 [Citricoccus parietis]|uniref:Uncharacterized protein n=1 Tax=Citricoccus parietis TaxID=592307 RepID=A0ABV5G5V2_9MICC